MDQRRGFRIATLNRLIAKGGLLVDEMQKAIDSSSNKKDVKEIPNKPVFDKGAVRLSSGVGGVGITAPSNPIINGEVDPATSKYKSGTYNVVVWIRPGGNLTKTLTNAIIVTAEAGDKKNADGTINFGGNSKMFGQSATWIQSVLNNIQRQMSNHFGNVSLGKWALAGFSAGGNVVAQTLGNLSKANLPDPDAVVILDGGHWSDGKDPTKVDKTKSVKNLIEYGRKAAVGKGRLVSVYSQIDPQGKSWITPQNRHGLYASTRAGVAAMEEELGMNKESYNGPSFGRLSPHEHSRKGNVHFIGAYKPGQGEMKKQHIDIAQSAGDIINLLGPDFNI